MLTNFTTLVNELQKTLRLELFSAVTSTRDKSNILIEENQPTVIMTCALKIGIKIAILFRRVKNLTIQCLYCIVTINYKNYYH